MNKKELVIFTDGSSLGNPGPGGYGVVILSPAYEEVIELGGAKPKTTNNEMEMSAVVAGLAYISNSDLPVKVFTDSKFVINGITKWINNWQKNNWQTAGKQPVSHKELWQSMWSLVSARNSGSGVTWHYVPGHTGFAGNERVDEIARSFASGKNPELYRGSFSGYGYDVFNYEELSLMDHKQSKVEPYYISLVDGKLAEHKTWAECESRVKGKSAKFKKISRLGEREEVLKKWGL